jgi:hypothetical protein
MKKPLVVLLAISFNLASAEVKKDLSKYQPIDKEFLVPINQPSHSNIKVSVNCTASDGRVLKSDDAGFGTCVEKSKSGAEGKVNAETGFDL